MAAGGPGRRPRDRVLEILDAANMDAEGDDPFWPHTTRGEALLLLAELPKTDLPRVQDCYQKAAGHPACMPRDRASMRRQIEILRGHLDSDLQLSLTDADLDKLFSQNDNPA